MIFGLKGLQPISATTILSKDGARLKKLSHHKPCLLNFKRNSIHPNQTQLKICVNILPIYFHYKGCINHGCFWLCLLQQISYQFFWDLLKFILKINTQRTNDGFLLFAPYLHKTTCSEIKFFPKVHGACLLSLPQLNFFI